MGRRWHGRTPTGELADPPSAWAAPRGSERRDPITGRQWPGMPPDAGYRPRDWPLPPVKRRLAGPLPEPRSGRFTGCGPKNYVRPDTRIREDVCDRLTADSFVDATEVDVRVTGGEVSLEGVVGTRHQRRHAEDAAASVRGVRDVHNRLRIEHARLALPLDGVACYCQSSL